jgi:hypothetical protein
VHLFEVPLVEGKSRPTNADGIQIHCFTASTMARCLFSSFAALTLWASFAPLVRGQGVCSARCDTYSGTDVFAPCISWCENNEDYFDEEYPYVLGPLALQPYPELTGIDGGEIKDLVGELWARIDARRQKIQFRYRMNTNPEPFYPYFAMHLHQGNLIPEEIGGHILVTIAGTTHPFRQIEFARRHWIANRFTFHSRCLIRSY